MNARWHIVDFNRISLILSEIVDFQPTSLMLVGMTLIAIGCHWVLGYHRPSSDIIDARSHIVDFIGRPWFSPERPNGLKATGARGQNNIEKHCGFKFVYQHMPMTQSISRCVVSWARCGPLGRIGTYWSQAPGVNTFRKYYELFVLCAAVSGCQLYYVIASSGAWRRPKGPKAWTTSRADVLWPRRPNGLKANRAIGS